MPLLNMRDNCFIIAEVGQAHDGSLGLAHSYIDAFSSAGVDAIKFQTHIALAESSPEEPFRINFSYVDKTRFDYWKRMEFTHSQWLGLKEHCDAVGVEFISTPFSVQAVDLLEDIGVSRYKVSSGDITNFLLLNRLAETKKGIILSSGMSAFSELDMAFKFLRGHGCDVSVLQCTSSYPTPPEKVGLRAIPEMMDRYQCTVGLSDHSGTIYPALGAVTLGAGIVEVHGVYDKTMFGPDSSSSLTIDELGQLVAGVRFLEKGLSAAYDKDTAAVSDTMKTIFGKTLAINKPMSAGSTIQLSDLECKKPAGQGIPTSDFEKVLGKSLSVDCDAWQFLTWDDVNE
jgi:N,N'-diacetyllegionaminate synthase